MPYAPTKMEATGIQYNTMRVRFPKRSLDFSIYLIIPAPLWPWDRLRPEAKIKMEVEILCNTPSQGMKSAITNA
jgi:hypothetical protein